MPETHPSASVLELDWLVGRWVATVPGSPNDCLVEPRNLRSELSLLAPWGGALAGLWRLGSDSVSLLTIRDVEGTIEWIQQEFHLTLDPHPTSPRIRLRLHSIAPMEIVFESTGETGHAHVKVFRIALTRPESEILTLRFLTPDEARGWVIVREEIHRLTTG
jgi:hypothetical protein